MKTIRIGVTGHRSLPSIDKLALDVREAIRRIEVFYLGGSEAPCSLIAVSPLAEGADRLVAREVLARPGAKLHAVLPLVREDYIRDFATEESRAEFLSLMDAAAEKVILGPQASRSDSYRAVGRYVVDHCDVLIALWDGQTTKGRGGTAEIVAYARERKRPLIRIDTLKGEITSEEGFD